MVFASQNEVQCYFLSGKIVPTRGAFAQMLKRDAQEFRCKEESVRMLPDGPLFAEREGVIGSSFHLGTMSKFAPCFDT